MLSTFARKCLVDLFAKPWQVWLCFVALALAAIYVVACPSHSPATRLRWSGVLLQVLGLVTTAVGIAQTRRLFGDPNVFSRLGSWVSARLAPPSKGLVFTGHIVEQADSCNAQGHVSATRTFGLEDRVAALEKELAGVTSRLDCSDQRLRAEAEAFGRDLSVERDERSAEDSKLHELLKLSATGGLRLSAVGVTWLIVGTIAAGIPAEITRLFS